MDDEALRCELQSIRNEMRHYEEAHAREHTLMDEASKNRSAAIKDRMEEIGTIREEVARADAKFITRSEWTSQHHSLETTVSALSRLVYIGLGVILAAQFVVGIIVLLVKK